MPPTPKTDAALLRNTSQHTLGDSSKQYFSPPVLTSCGPVTRDCGDTIKSRSNYRIVLYLLSSLAFLNTPMNTSIILLLLPCLCHHVLQDVHGPFSWSPRFRSLKSPNQIPPMISLQPRNSKRQRYAQYPPTSHVARQLKADLTLLHVFANVSSVLVLLLRLAS